MDVSISAFRANLKTYVEQASAGDDIVITERGIPVARLTAVESLSALDRLIRDGVVTPPASSTRTRASQIRRVRATGSVSDLVAELRRKR